jgi:hypothetical protein
MEGLMNVNEAIAAAKDYVKTIYADEQVSHLGLEEVEYDDGFGRWNITLGFSRPWNRPSAVVAGLEAVRTMSPLRRSFKVVTIASDGKVISMKNGPRAEATE